MHFKESQLLCLLSSFYLNCKSFLLSKLETDLNSDVKCRPTSASQHKTQLFAFERNGIVAAVRENISSKVTANTACNKTDPFEELPCCRTSRIHDFLVVNNSEKLLCNDKNTAWCIDLHMTQPFRLVGKFAKRNYYVRQVRPSAWNSSVPTGQIFMKFDIPNFFSKICQ